MIIDFLKKGGKNTMLAALSMLALVGVLLVILSNSRNDDFEKKENNDELYGYTASIEQRLEKIIEKISGVGEADVMVTFESSFESVFASNARLESGSGVLSGNENKNTEKELVLIQGGSGKEEPVLLKKLCPRVKGVFVVCRGGAKESTVREIKLAAAALFGISESKICVTSSKVD